MAHATVITKITRVASGVQLELTQEEAEVLAVILSKVGGNISRSRRKYADEIQSVLWDAGVQWNKVEWNKVSDGLDREGCSGSIHFPDER